MTNRRGKAANDNTRAAGIHVQVRRTNLNDDYLIAPNALFRGTGIYAGLSEFARLWLAAGLSCANEWDTEMDSIEAWLPSLGRDRHEAVRRELRERGFLSMTRTKIPAGQPDAGKFVWTFAFFMDPLPESERDRLQVKTGRRRKAAVPPCPDGTGTGNAFEQVNEPAGDAMPGPAGHAHAGHGSAGPAGQGDVYKEEKNQFKKNQPPPTPRDPAAPPTAAEAETREGEGPFFDETTRQALTGCVQQVQQIRPGWSPKSVTAAMLRALDDGRAPAAVIAAILAVARDRMSKVPGRLNAEGDWWGVPPAAARPPADARRCSRVGHETELADSCRFCVAEAKAVDVDQVRVVVGPVDEAKARGDAFLAQVWERRGRVGAVP